MLHFVFFTHGGCYANAVDAIVAGEEHYLITVKDNQPTLLNEAKEVFAGGESNGFEGVECYQESDRGHGRIGERTYYAVSVPKESPLRKKWQHSETFVIGVFHCTVRGQTSTQTRYMISDLPCENRSNISRFPILLPLSPANFPILF